MRALRACVHRERLARNRERAGSHRASVFAATLKPTVPLPVPLAPVVTVIHAALLAALHAQAGFVATVTGVPAPPAAPMD